jgi:predicted ATPase
MMGAVTLLLLAGVVRDSGPSIGEGPMHRIYERFIGAGRAYATRRVRQFHKPTETQVVSVVLTGGPCAGKSSSLAPLMDAAKAEGFDVYCAPEAATMVFNCGFSFPSPNDPHCEEKILAFQKALFKLQLQMERSMTLMAASTGRPSILIFDRGLLDGKAYMLPESWERLLREVACEGRDAICPFKDAGADVTEEYLMQRYDGVIHMITAADGAAAFYKHSGTIDDQGNAVFRRETAAEAIAQDRRTQECWSEHPHLAVVKNPQSEEDGTAGGYSEGSEHTTPDYFQRKLATTTEAVLAIARKAHPLQPECDRTFA